MIKVVFILLCSVPAFLWYRHTGDISLYLTEQMPPGQLPYIFSKLAGMYALLMMMWQVIMTLIERLACRLNISVSVRWLGVPHKVSGMIVFGLVIVHFLLFFSAVSMRQGYPAFGLLLPNLTDYFHLHVSAGLVAFWCLCVVAATGIYAGIKNRAVSRWHGLYSVSLGLACLHGLSIGSELAALMGTLFAGVLGTIVALLFVTKIGLVGKKEQTL